jgi:hypothetical protein
MLSTQPNTDHVQPTTADDTRPRFFLDDAYDANTDGDWWLDLGRVDLPVVPGV